MENNLNNSGTFFEPMTFEESLRYIELLESNHFIYDEWEITRDLHHIKKFDSLLTNCDPRLQPVAL